MSPRIFDARITARMHVAGMRGLEAAARKILEESQPLVPVATGALKRSGFVERERDQVAVGYNDPKATAAHENTRVRHENGQQAKYLEQPLTQSTGVIADSIAREIRVETS